MSLLEPNEITITALMADLPMQRHAQHQLQMQLLTLQEGLELQNSPIAQDAPSRQHVVSENETLAIVSVRVYGSPNYWQLLADVNGIEYPFIIYPGQILQVPEVNNG